MPPATPAPVAPAVVPVVAVAPLSPTAARCDAGLRSLERDAKSLAEALATFRRECAEVQREPRCRTAWTAAATAPRARQMRVLLRGCRDAYCAHLPEPTPALCRGPLPTGAALDAAWAEFQRAVWRHELGPEAGRLEGTLVRAFYEAGERWPAHAPTARSR